MQNKRLAEWLEEHAKMLSTTEYQEDSTFHVALYECIIDMALHGETRMVDSLIESTAAYAVATERELSDLLGVPELLRERIWQRIGEEVDPEPAYAMFSAVDVIFVHIIKVTIDEYLAAFRQAQAARAAEISRLYTESERKVMAYATEVARANRELARLEQAKTDFISIAAHELKTPLTLIQGYVNILRDMQTDSKLKSLTEGIGRGADRMNNIIEDMLDLSAMDMRQLGLVLEKVNLQRSIELVVTQMESALVERKQIIEITDLDQLPPIEADARRLHQIFRQLIGNAIKYTPDGGHIKISGQTFESRPIRRPWVKLTIEDNGVGIAPEDKEKIFEKFYRAAKSSLHSTGQTKFMGAGPGLGLAIVRGLLHAHGGQITADSPGFDPKNFPGSVFTVTLPVKANPAKDVHIQWFNPDEAAPAPDVASPPESKETEKII